VLEQRRQRIVLVGHRWRVAARRTVEVVLVALGVRVLIKGARVGPVLVGAEDEELDLEVGADVAVGDEGEYAAAREPLDGADELVLHGALEGVSLSSGRCARCRRVARSRSRTVSEH
jgi:hypothetical protein